MIGIVTNHSSPSSYIIGITCQPFQLPNTPGVSTSGGALAKLTLNVISVVGNSQGSKLKSYEISDDPNS